MASVLILTIWLAMGNQERPQEEMFAFVRCTRDQVVRLEPSGEPASDLAKVIMARCNSELAAAAMESMRRADYPKEAFPALIRSFREDVQVSLIGQIAERRAARLSGK